MRPWLKILPAFLYERIVRRHGQIFVIQRIRWASDGGSILVRTMEQK
jgi:hypothetical protein